jgi:hypothetical protein
MCAGPPDYEHLPDCPIPQVEAVLAELRAKAAPDAPPEPEPEDETNTDPPSIEDLLARVDRLATRQRELKERYDSHYVT